MDTRTIVHKILTETAPEMPDAFWAWFGDSKVTDDAGDPLVVYHGTSTPAFEKFSTRRRSVPGAGRLLGAYFTDDPKVASHFATGGLVYAQIRGARVLPVYLRMEHPADFREPTRRDVLDRLQIPDYDKERLLAVGPIGFSGLEMLDRKFDLVRRLKRMGYDGIIFDGEHEGTTYVVFKPTQVKSATGNRGTFDPSDPRIDH